MPQIRLTGPHGPLTYPTLMKRSLEDLDQDIMKRRCMPENQIVAKGTHKLESDTGTKRNRALKSSPTAISSLKIADSPFVIGAATSPFATGTIDKPCDNASRVENCHLPSSNSSAALASPSETADHTPIKSEENKQLIKKVTLGDEIRWKVDQVRKSLEEHGQELLHMCSLLAGEVENAQHVRVELKKIKSESNGSESCYSKLCQKLDERTTENAEWRLRREQEIQDLQTQLSNLKSTEEEREKAVQEGQQLKVEMKKLKTEQMSRDKHMAAENQALVDQIRNFERGGSNRNQSSAQDNRKLKEDLERVVGNRNTLLETQRSVAARHLFSLNLARKEKDALRMILRELRIIRDERIDDCVRKVVDGKDVTAAIADAFQGR